MSITAYTILRVALGVNIFMHGFIRIKNGITEFKKALEREYENSILPALLVKRFASFLPATEVTIGALLVVGFLTKAAIIAGVLLMILLMVGKSIKNDWMVVSLQMIYFAFYSALEFFLQYNQFSADYFFEHL
jgi:thiosulfate dehydrogenase (quinone) large subunit